MVMLRMRIRIAICDDDIIICKQLEEIITAYSIIHNEDIEIICFNSTEELLISTLKYEILFLDIRFDKKDIGIDVARLIRQNGNDGIIILLTSLNSKAIEGYNIGAYRYIVKPINNTVIYTVLTDAISKIRNSEFVIFVKHKYGTEVIPTNSIILIQSNARKRIITSINNEIETWESLKSIYDQLPKGQFAYIQKSCIVNFAKIRTIRKNEVTLEAGINVGISRQLRPGFLSLYFTFAGG